MYSFKWNTHAKISEKNLPWHKVCATLYSQLYEREKKIIGYIMETCKNIPLSVTCDKHISHHHSSYTKAHAATLSLWEVTMSYRWKVTKQNIRSLKPHKYCTSLWYNSGGISCALLNSKSHKRSTEGVNGSKYCIKIHLKSLCYGDRTPPGRYPWDACLTSVMILYTRDVLLDENKCTPA